MHNCLTRTPLSNLSQMLRRSFWNGTMSSPIPAKNHSETVDAHISSCLQIISLESPAHHDINGEYNLQVHTTLNLHLHQVNPVKIRSMHLWTTHPARTRAVAAYRRLLPDYRDWNSTPNLKYHDRKEYSWTRSRRVLIPWVFVKIIFRVGQAPGEIYQPFLS